MPKKNGFNPLELAILQWIKRKQDNAILSGQIDNAEFKRREWTKAGYYIYFAVPNNPQIGKLTDSPAHGPVHGPNIRSNQIQDGGGSILWAADGVIDCLELFAYGNSFEKEIFDFSLSD
jgi:hypothetical protein